MLAWSCYAVHPMSYYGRGGVSADFPGMARARRQSDDPGVFQIYFTGCAGDTTAGKYNTGDPRTARSSPTGSTRGWSRRGRPRKRQPLDRGRRSAWPSCRCRPGTTATSPSRPCRRRWPIPRPPAGSGSRAALGLSWRQRVDAGPAGRRAVPGPGGGAAQFTDPAGRELRRLPACGPAAPARLVRRWWPASATAPPATSPPTSAGRTATTTLLLGPAMTEKLILQAAAQALGGKKTE